MKLTKLRMIANECVRLSLSAASVPNSDCLKPNPNVESDRKCHARTHNKRRLSSKLVMNTALMCPGMDLGTHQAVSKCRPSTVLVSATLKWNAVSLLRSALHRTCAPAQQTSTWHATLNHRAVLMVSGLSFQMSSLPFQWMILNNMVQCTAHYAPFHMKMPFRRQMKRQYPNHE